LQERGLRFYSPEVGRWLSRDPIGEIGGWHLYAFCFNDALNGVDPLGQAVWLLLGGTVVEETKADLEKKAKEFNDYVDELLKKTEAAQTGGGFTFFWDEKEVDAQIFVERLKREKLTVLTAPFKSLEDDIKTIETTVKNHSEDWDATVYNHHTMKVTADGSDRVIGYVVRYAEFPETPVDNVKEAVAKVKRPKGTLHHVTCFLNAAVSPKKGIFRRKMKFDVTWPTKRGRDEKWCKIHYGPLQVRTWEFDE
jgi:hypothetical protein